ncbi:MAG TPA: ATP-binding cassette domain-containing protein, partial [Chitinophagaceae bacterium]|nr:ATP-binding cassette domain-containing protein [Chitinophagaceae bacterium]
MLTSTENISLIEGNNFSGRSDYLRTVTSFNESETSDAKNVFIGAVPRNYISGLSTTSAFELKLHSKNENVSHNNSVNVFLKEIGFDHLLNHDPFKLSGGEQTILTVASAMLLAPSTLAIDCTLEQLNEQWKNPLINLFRMNKEINYLIADNRTEEYSNLIKRIRISDIDKRVDDEKIKFRDISIPDALPDIIKKNIANKFEIRNLSFAYQKNKPVLKDISFNLETGKIYFLEGMNGAGKSTLAKILTGVLKPEKNTSFFMDGRKVNPYEHPGKIFGYCYQNPD